MKKHYVCGFVFDLPGNEVVLILKNKPHWMKGRWNGVGGLIEENELPGQAMDRECEEECGLTVFSNDWQEFCVLRTCGGVIHFFKHHSSAHYKAAARTDEPVKLFRVTELPLSCMPNLHWLIPMALSFGRGELAKAFEVTELYEKGN